MIEILGGIFFLLVGICGCLYPILIENDKRHRTFNKSENMFNDEDNT